MRYDFHVHTTYSDGTYSPADVIKLAIEKGLDGLAITDHDTIDGLKEALTSKQVNNFEIIPGIELSCTYEEEEVHILGYLFDVNNKELLAMSDKLKLQRKNRIYEISKKLSKLNIKIPVEDLLKENKYGSIGRPHIARKLVELNYCESIQKAFDLYLKKGCPGYVPRYKLEVSDAINLINNAGGFSVLAHPGLLQNKDIVKLVVEKGIDGIEVFHPKNGPKESRKFKKITINNNIIYTAGSDFHGSRENLPIDMGSYYIETDLTMKEWLMIKRGDKN